MTRDVPLHQICLVLRNKVQLYSAKVKIITWRRCNDTMPLWDPKSSLGVVHPTPFLRNIMYKPRMRKYAGSADLEICSFIVALPTSTGMRIHMSRPSTSYLESSSTHPHMTSFCRFTFTQLNALKSSLNPRKFLYPLAIRCEKDMAKYIHYFLVQYIDDQTIFLFKKALILQLDLFQSKDKNQKQIKNRIIFKVLLHNVKNFQE